MLRFLRDLRIRYKLLAGTAAVFILCLSGGSLVIYEVVRRTIETKVESELQNTTSTILNMVRTSAATSIKNHLRAVAEKNLEIVAHFHDRAAAGELSVAEAQARARDILLCQTIGKTGYIYGLDHRGVIALHPKRELVGVDLSEHAFIREQKRRREGYLEYDWQNPGETRSRPKALYMTYFAPWDWIISVSSYRAEFRELVNVDDFRDSILSLQFGQTGYSYVIDGQGNMVLHPKVSGNYLHARDQEGKAFVQEICTRKNGKIVYSWENPGETVAREKLVIFNHIPEYDWIVASSSYLDEFYAPLKTIRQLVLVTVLASLLVALPVTFRISSSITKPLQELMQRFSSGAAGDIGVRLTPRSRDEIGMLARYFNQFMERLEAYSRSLTAEIRVRQRAEAAIRESEAKYRELVENANSIILKIDTRGRVTFFNEFAQRFFGRSEPEMLGKPLLAHLIPAVDSMGRDLEGVLQRLCRDPERFPAFESETLGGDGQRAWVSWTHRAVRSPRGELIGGLLIGNDVTAARRAEQEVSRMRHYFRSIIDAMPSILVAVDRDGRISQWNREAEKATGRTPTEAVGRPLAEALPFLGPLALMVREAIGAQRVRQAEKLAYTAMGAERIADVMIYPLAVEGLEGAVIRVDDVTARVRMEDTLIQTEKLLSVGGLAAGMAHEINNPLSGMLQNAQNILRRIQPDLPPNRAAARECGIDLAQLHRYLDMRGIIGFIEGIRASGERVSATVARMLNFSRPSGSRMEPTRLDELLEKTLALAAHDYDLKKNYDFRQIRIVREFEPGLPPVPCLPNELEQVILNLLRNAAQALRLGNPPPGDPCIWLRLRQDNGALHLQVADNGPGMEEATRKRVFEPFFTTKEVGVGTGLGLSVSYFIVTQHHGGTLTVDAAPGQGARFTLSLPIEAPPSRPAAPPGEAS